MTRVVEGPVTEAGRRVLDRWGGMALPPGGYDPTLSEWAAAILAIETEAAQAARAEVIAEMRAGVRRLPRRGTREGVALLSRLDVLALLPPTEPKS